MVQLPNVVGLVLCEQVITDATTRNVTLVNCFSRLRCPIFPSPPQWFVVSTVLTDGLGEATMALVVSRLDTLEIVGRRQWPMRFHDPQRATRLILRLTELSFPVAGGHQFILSADGEWVAQTSLQVSS